SSSDQLWTGIALRAALGASVTVNALAAWRLHRPSGKEFCPSPSGTPEALCPALEQWLKEEGLNLYRPALKWHGYSNLQLLSDLSGPEVDEMLQVVQLRAGHAAQMRRSLIRLRQNLLRGACHDSPAVPDTAGAGTAAPSTSQPAAEPAA
ncbi:unnamed protein product, partial [Polarella glacialis]